MTGQHVRRISRSVDRWCALIYWDNTNKQCTTTSTSNTKIGVATAAAANPSSVGNVRLNAVFCA